MKKHTPEEIAQLVKSTRLARQMTQKTLAEKAAISPVTLSFIENGKSQTIENLEKISSALAVPLVSLIGGEEKSKKESKKEIIKVDKKQFKKTTKKVVQAFLKEHEEEIMKRVEQAFIQK